MTDSQSSRQASTETTLVYLGLGSNMGDRRANLDKALELLSQRVSVLEVSSTYDTEPVGNVSQPRFLNLACKVSTRLEPIGLLTLLKGIESKLGRKQTGPNTPRPIDIDILFFGELAMDSPKLTIPHPRLIERAFVLVPLADITPDLVHPVTGKTVLEMLKSLQKGVQGVFKWQEG
ncbi:MAG TPA: 2-amino-4-hydroxy-6-hydroxymethyldihydropteridine diphosphokinase [Dehalococcoidia bacterium]|nr:2-amino-4-hydroxy-6-hydroxymethyldihydropteridine diphosphokinase [Dehalococcoidia bacterium]